MFVDEEYPDVEVVRRVTDNLNIGQREGMPMKKKIGWKFTMEKADKKLSKY